MEAGPAYTSRDCITYPGKVCLVIHTLGYHLISASGLHHKWNKDVNGKINCLSNVQS